MLIGHYAVGLAGRAALRGKGSPALGTWFLAVQWLDLIWPFFVLGGIERVDPTASPNPFLQAQFTHYPWSHSLVMAIAWGLLFARWNGKRGTIGLWLAAAVVSHWVLDWVVHVPDLPLVPTGGIKVGLGLWRNVTATVLIEGTLFVAAVAWYLRRTRPRDAIGRWSFVALAGLLAAIYALAAQGAAGPPPSGTAIALPALLLWLFVPWGYWIDRHRSG